MFCRRRLATVACAAAPAPVKSMAHRHKTPGQSLSASETRSKKSQQLGGPPDHNTGQVLEVAILRPDGIAKLKRQSENLDIFGIAVANQLVRLLQAEFVDQGLTGDNRQQLELAKEPHFRTIQFSRQQRQVFLDLEQRVLGRVEGELAGENHIASDTAQQRGKQGGLASTMRDSAKGLTAQRLARGFKVRQYIGFRNALL